MKEYMLLYAIIFLLAAGVIMTCAVKWPKIVLPIYALFIVLISFKLGLL